MISNIFLVLTTIIALFASASAYFWSSSDQASAPPAQYYYHKRLLQGPAPGYSLVENDQRQQVPPGSLPLPSVPIQTPIRAQLSPYSSVHQVQLVPCMCPVSQDYPFENYHPQENIYVPVQPLQHQLQLQPAQVQQPQMQQPQQQASQQQKVPK